MTETEEERTRALRKIEAEKAKKEKLEAKLERERIKAELARDKELRRANNGVLPSVLGVDGYNPSAVQAPKSDAKRSREDETPQPAETKQMKPSSVTATTAPPSQQSTASATSAAATVTNPVKKVAPSTTSPSIVSNSGTDDSNQTRMETIESSISTIARYRTGGDGGQALNLLLLFLKNIRDNPQDPK